VAEGVEQYEVFALRLASADRPARDTFLEPGQRSGRIGIDFSCWLIRGGGRRIVVDTGFNERSGTARGRRLSAGPATALRRLGVAADDVEQVVISHLHYDHAGNLGDFGSARYVLQERELAYAAGPCMCDAGANHYFEVDDVAAVLWRSYAGRVDFVDGSTEIAPGVEVHRIGGHTPGLQVVRVRTERGWVVLASDAAHYYDNLAERNPFPSLVDLDEMLAGYDRIAELADSADHIVPGHDPAVFVRYPTPSDEGRLISGAESDGAAAVVSLHLPPVREPGGV